MNRIKELRNEKGINQEVLANLLGLEIAGISKLETGRVPLKDEYIIKLANYFDVSTDYLLGNSNIRDNATKIALDNKIDIAFYEGYKDLNEDDKEVMRSTLEAFLKKNKKK